MNYQNDDLRIKEIKELLPPVALLEKFPATENAANTVAHARKAIHKILKGNDDRLLVMIGPCSIHDPVAAKEYATRLLALREAIASHIGATRGIATDPSRILITTGIQEGLNLLAQLLIALVAARRHLFACVPGRCDAKQVQAIPSRALGIVIQIATCLRSALGDGEARFHHGHTRRKGHILVVRGVAPEVVLQRLRGQHHLVPRPYQHQVIAAGIDGVDRVMWIGQRMTGHGRLGQ